MNSSMTAQLKYATTSYQKMWLIAKMVRGKRAEDALVFLEHLPKTWAKIMRKVVKSAVANAVNNAGEKSENLVVDRIEVGRWPKLKRMKFVWRARIHGYLRHRSCVKVVLAAK